MALTDAKRRANNKYIKENMTTLGCKMRKDDATEFKSACAAMGTTPNAVFRKAVDEFMEEFWETHNGEKQKQTISNQ